MLCSVPQYRRITGDMDTEDWRISVALADAQRAVEEFTQRELEFGTYTESCRIYRNGRVYPKAFPITSVTDPVTAFTDGAAIVLQHQFAGDWGGSHWTDAIPSGFINEFTPRINVTYTGGYTSENVPYALVKVIAQLAAKSLSPSDLDALPAGTTRARVDLVEVWGPVGSSAGLPPGVRSVLARFRRPQVA